MFAVTRRRAAGPLAAAAGSGIDKPGGLVRRESCDILGALKRRRRRTLLSAADANRTRTQQISHFSEYPFTAAPPPRTHDSQAVQSAGR